MKVNNENDIVIVAAKRTPMGHYGGFFKDIPAHALGALVIKALLEEAETHATVRPLPIEEVLMGCVLSAGQGQAPARQAALGAGLSITTGCTTINKMCGSGMKAIMLAHDILRAQKSGMIIAGGFENMSLAPYLLRKARFGYYIGHGQVWDHMMLDGLEDAYDIGKPMGYFAEQCAEKYGITRDSMDEFAAQSLLRAKKANENGYFSQEIVPVSITLNKEKHSIVHDERALKADPQKISQLKPAFKENGCITAANASSLSDGAAALWLISSREAELCGLKPLAKIVGHFTHAQEPAWFTTAPIGAVQGLLKKINWNIQEIDLFEINEAFAVVTLVTLQALRIPEEKVNIHGGACALGHPIGASGARILVTLLHALLQNHLKRGVATLCIGGGEATALAIEMID